MSNLELLVKDIEGVEFYTDAKGRSGVSQSGLAILCGVNRRTISDLIKSLSGQAEKSKIDESLESFVGKVSEHCTETETGMVLLSGELSAAIIEHYAFKGRKPAQYSLRKFAAIGFNTWVQSITGWQAAQPESQSSEPPEPEVIMPTAKELDYMRSRQWEKDEMVGKRLVSDEAMKRSGYRRALEQFRAMRRAW